MEKNKMRKTDLRKITLSLIAVLLSSFVCTRSAAESNPFADLERPAAASITVASAKPDNRASSSAFTRYELMSYFKYAAEDTRAHIFHQVVGIEYLKRFSDAYATRSSFNAQFQLVYEDHSGENGIFNKMHKRGLKTDLHNFYLDVFQALDTFMSAEARAANLGRFNFRIGRYYLPFGINLQTDTHATLLQLSNEEHFGFERDWYAGFYGAVNDNLKYDLYWMLGSGHDAVNKQQDGLVGGRLSLAGKYLYERGLEGGIAIVSGERLGHAGEKTRIQTTRYGLDGRYTRAISGGTLTTTCESAFGKDDEQDIISVLGQLEFLDSARQNGLAMQYRHFRRNKGMENMMMGGMSHKNGSDASLFLEYTRYLHNDISGNRLEWIKFLLEKPTETREMIKNARDLRLTVQYYSYF